MKIHPPASERNHPSQKNNSNVLMIRGFAPDDPQKPDTGSVEFLARMQSGSFENCSRFFLLTDDEPMEDISLLKVKKGWGKRVKLTLDFNFLAQGGMEEYLERMLKLPAFLVGIGQEALEVNSFETQQQWLKQLSEQLLPNRAQAIQNLLLHAFLIQPNIGHATGKSHLFGAPKRPATMGHTPTCPNGIPLLHIGTFYREDTPKNIQADWPAECISFYLKEGDYDERWPEEQEEFAVLTHEEEVSTPENPEAKYPKVPVRLLPFLDIPDVYHSKLKALQFSAAEESMYESLYRGFKYLTFLHVDLNAHSVFLGYPVSIQNGVEYEAERTFNENSDEIVDLEKAAQWKLLLQLDPYHGRFPFHENFGDGTIYFMVHEEDWENKSLKRVQIIAQGT